MKRLSDVQLVKEHNGVKAGRLFQIGTKLYEVLGFDLEDSEVFARRILRKTMKPSRKQPIFETFKLGSVHLDQQVSFKGLFGKY
jgi:hypothetical protein